MEIKLCYFNEHWNIYIYTKNTKLLPESEEKKDINGGVLRLTKYIDDEIPCLYDFGFMTIDLNKRPGHGGEWSSNAQFVNKVYNTDLTEIGYNGYSMAISLEWLKSILGDKVIWGISSLGNPEIKEVVGEETGYHKWVVVYNNSLMTQS